MLSTEANRRPVEPHVVPVVYELFASGLARPSWSSEGHCDADGQLSTWPGVWFTSASFTYLNLLDTALTVLHHDGHTHRPWRVELCDTQPEPGTALYTLGPARSGELPTLHALHEDLRAVAQCLEIDVRNLARRDL